MNPALAYGLAAYYLILAAVWLVRKSREARVADHKRLTTKQRADLARYWWWCR